MLFDVYIIYIDIFKPTETSGRSLVAFNNSAIFITFARDTLLNSYSYSIYAEGWLMTVNGYDYLF